jgi:hypothetical protein
MCVSVCTGLTIGDAFSITTVAPISLDDARSPTGTAFINSLSAVGPTFTNFGNGFTTAVCLYDFLLIAGGRDANNVEADRYCGNALNPVPINTPATATAAAAVVPPLVGPAAGGLPNSVQVCSKFFKNGSYSQLRNLFSSCYIECIVTASVRPFRMTYRTDGQETPVLAVPATNTIGALADTANTGFCLDYQER